MPIYLYLFKTVIFLAKRHLFKQTLTLNMTVSNRDRFCHRGRVTQCSRIQLVGMESDMCRGVGCSGGGLIGRPYYALPSTIPRYAGC